MSDELKPCPFCGGEAELNQARDTRIHWRVHCTTMSCPANCINVWEMKEEIAIQKWNTRKPVEKIKKQIKVRKMIHSEKNECDAELDSYVSCAFDEAIEIVEKGEQ